MKITGLGLPERILAALFVSWMVSVSNGTAASGQVPAAPVTFVSSAGPTHHCTGSEGRSVPRSRKTGWRRDPFQLLPEEGFLARGRAANGARLVAIIEGQKGRMAIFGHSVVQRGDLVGNETILDIAHNRVMVLRDGCKRIIAMEEAR